MRRAALAPAVHEWIVSGYLVAIAALAISTARGVDRTTLASVALLLLVTLLQVVRRAGWFGVLSGFAHRGTMVFAVLGSYLQLRALLERACPDLVDARLLAMDLDLFGCVPALALDATITPFRTAWFSFFYLSYFALMAGAAVLILGSPTGIVLEELGVALVFVFCTSHLLYFLVPAFGPVRSLADSYARPLDGRLYRLVLDVVSAGGATRDVFPSLHTAAPTMLALLSYRHRRSALFRFSWPFLAFAAVNIIGATLYLRWHYAVDVLAGGAVAGSSVAFAAFVVPWERARRASLGVDPAWPELFGPVDTRPLSAGHMDGGDRKWKTG